MPRPSSPTRRKKSATAKKPAAPPPPPPHYPSPDSPVLTLPGALSDEGTRWWNQYIGPDFLKKKKQRGNKNGAKGWVRKTFCGPWWQEHLPDVDVSLEDKIWYFDKTSIGTLLYAYINTSSIRGSKGRQPAGPTALKKKAYGHDSWRRENPELVKEVIERWRLEHNKEPNVGEKRAIASAAFKELSAEEQETWREQAKMTLETGNALAKLDDPNERDVYVSNFKKAIDDLSKEAEAVAGIKVCSMILYQKQDGNYKIDRKVSEGLRGFGKSSALTSAMGSLQDWVTATAGKVIMNGVPAPVVYPDWSKDGYPTLPNYRNLRLGPTLDLTRQAFKGYFHYQGGAGRLGWSEMAQDMPRYFDPARLPQGFDTKFGDPSTFSLPVAIGWLDFFWKCQIGKVPPEKRFQFALVPAGTTPIHESESEESSRELVTIGGKQTWVLRFTSTVTKCHQVGGMKYDPAALEYADFLAVGLAYADAVCAPPANWLGLPVAGPNTPDRVISGTEQEGLLALAGLLPESQANRITGLLDALIDHQHHIPASHSQGVYASTKSPPKAIPPSPQSNVLPDSMWLGPSYFQPPHLAPPNGTVAHFEDWQEDVKKVLVHEPSGTLYGGDTGVVRVARPLIQLLLNFSAVRGDFTALEDHPIGYDLSRLPINGWPRLIQWIDSWTLSIRDSTTILRKTSDERRKGLNGFNRLPEDDSTACQDPPTDTGNDVVPEPVPSNELAKGAKRTRGGSRSKGKRRAEVVPEDEEPAPEDESQDEGGDIDYEALDRTPQDDGGEEEMQDWDCDRGNSNNDDDSVELDRLDSRVTLNTTGHASTSSDAWIPVSGVFGKFLELPPVVPLSITTPHDIIKALRASDSTCTQALDRFHLYMKDNPRAPPLLVDNARTLSHDFPTHVQLLYHAIFLRRACWKRAEAAAPIIFDHAQKIILAFRAGTHLSLAAQRIVEHDIFPDPGPTAVEFAKQIIKSKSLLVELRWTFKELVAFQALATKWHGTLEGDWMNSEPPSDLTKLVRIVQGLVDWADETAALISDHQSKRKALLRKCCPTAPFDKRCNTSGMYYRFGCPSISEESDGLRDSLKAAKATLEHGSTHDGSTAAADVNRTGEGDTKNAQAAIAVDAGLPTAGTVPIPASPITRPPAAPLLIPAATVSVPAPTPSVPTATPSVPAATPSVPAAIPSVSAATPSVPAATLPVPSTTATASCAATPAVTDGLSSAAPIGPGPAPIPEGLRRPSPIPINRSVTETSEERPSKRTRNEVEPGARRVSGRIASANAEPPASRTRSGAQTETRAASAKGTKGKSAPAKRGGAKSVGAGSRRGGK